MSINFSLDPWTDNLKALQEFHTKYKHWDVPKNYDKPLSDWVRRQRTSRKGGELLQDRIDRLDAIGFDWRTKTEQDWDLNFQKLAKGEVVPSSWEDEQRKKWREGNLSEDQIKLLESIGMRADPRSETLDDHIKELVAFRVEFGHWNVSIKYDKTLYGVVNNLRTAFNNEELSQDYIDRLDAIGFDWRGVHQQKWDEMFQKLANGEDVPNWWKEAQRASYRKGSLAKDRRKRLEQVGFKLEVN